MIKKVLAIQDMNTTKYITLDEEYPEWHEFFEMLCQPHVEEYVILDIFPCDFEYFNESELDNALYNLLSAPFGDKRNEAFDFLWKFAEEACGVC